QALGAPQSANRERALVDAHETVVGAHPDVVLQILQQLVGILIDEALLDSQAPETGSAVRVPRFENVHSGAEGRDPEAATRICEQRGDVACAQRAWIRCHRQNALDGMADQIEAIEAFLRTYPQEAAGACERGDALVGEAVREVCMRGGGKLAPREVERPEPVG